MKRRIGILLLLFIALCMAAGCSVRKSADEDTSALGSVVVDKVDAPESVLEKAKELVAKWYDDIKGGEADYSYSNWRIEHLEHCYSYNDFEGMVLEVYQLNYEFLSDFPDSVVLAGGMTVADDGWVMPGYPDCTYLIFSREEENLTYLTSMMANDCVAGSETFTSDLRAQLDQANRIK